MLRFSQRRATLLCFDPDPIVSCVGRLDLRFVASLYLRVRVFALPLIAAHLTFFAELGFNHPW